MSHSRPQPISNHHLRVDRLIRDDLRSKSKLANRDDNISSAGSRMSFGKRHKMSSHRLTSNISLHSDLKTMTVNSP